MKELKIILSVKNVLIKINFNVIQKYLFCIFFKKKLNLIFIKNGI